MCVLHVVLANQQRNSGPAAESTARPGYPPKEAHEPRAFPTGLGGHAHPPKSRRRATCKHTLGDTLGRYLAFLYTGYQITRPTGATW